MENKTPRTDHKEYTQEYGGEPVVESRFARELETELSKANFTIKKQNENHQRYCNDADAWISALETELSKANELLLKTNQTYIENQQLRKDLDGERETNQRLTDELAESEKKAFAYKTALEMAESELIDARAELDMTMAEQRAFEEMLKEARAEIERKSALIEQMRESLEWALSFPACTCDDHDTRWQYQQTCNCGHADRVQRAMAALSAAEGGEGL